LNFALARKKSGWTAQHRQKEEQDRLDSERERGELEAEIRAPLKRNGWNMNHGCSLRRLHRRHLLIGLKQASLPGEIPMVPLAPKPAEPEPAHGVAGKRPLKQLIAFFAIAAFTVGVRTVHPSPTANATPRILEEKAPPIPEVAVQASAHQTTPFAVEAAPVRSINATPTKEELVRTAFGQRREGKPLGK